VVLAIVLLSACGGGGGDERTDREITDEELSLMVLPQSELGSQYAEFLLDEGGSGFQTNESQIEAAFDKDDEAKDVERFGRLNGYDQSFISPDALQEGKGVFAVGTTLGLYEDAEGASGDFQDVPEDLRRSVAKTSEEATLTDMQDFDPGEIGDGSGGLVLTFDIAGQGVRVTTVGFREGRLVADAVIARADDEDVREEATALARKLDERLLAVLRGEVEPEPTAASEPTPTPGAGVSPSDALGSFRFRSETAIELGGGMTITADGEFEAPDRLTCTIGVSIDGTEAGTENLVVIGGDAWLDTGEGFEATSANDPSATGDLDLCAGSPAFWKGFDFLQELGPITGQSETVNGVVATRYRLGEAAETLGSLGFLPAQLEGVTIKEFDVWAAEDGGWPVAVNVDFSFDAKAASEAFGLPLEEGATEARVTTRVDITDVNGADIHVEPPAP